ncbi:MAG: hypothetical protein IT539_10550 [Bradyrhizobiaceae bacterium]|nr:hypothetical protein [Bradyrhizobiaceae bacterium]
MRRRRRAAAVLAVTVFAALCVAPSGALAQAKKSKGGTKAVPAKPATTWTYTRALGTPTLAYGIEARDDFQITFSCQPDAGLLRVISLIGSRSLRPGDGAAIRLRNGKAHFEVAGTAFSTETRKQIDVAGTTKFDAALFNLFQQGETVILEVPGQRRSLTLNNAKAAAEAFEKACARTKPSN